MRFGIVDLDGNIHVATDDFSLTINDGGAYGDAFRLLFETRVKKAWLFGYKYAGFEHYVGKPRETIEKAREMIIDFFAKEPDGIFDCRKYFSIRSPAESWQSPTLVIHDVVVDDTSDVGKTKPRERLSLKDIIENE